MVSCCPLGCLLTAAAQRKTKKKSLLCCTEPHRVCHPHCSTWCCCCRGGLLSGAAAALCGCGCPDGRWLLGVQALLSTPAPLLLLSGCPPARVGHAWCRLLARTVGSVARPRLCAMLAQLLLLPLPLLLLLHRMLPGQRLAGLAAHPVASVMSGCGWLSRQQVYAEQAGHGLVGDGVHAEMHGAWCVHPQTKVLAC